MATPEPILDAAATAAPAAASLNPGLASLLGMLGGSGVSGLDGLQSQLGQLAASNPQWAPLLQLLQPRIASSHAEEEPEQPVARDHASGPAAADVQVLMEHAQSLEAEVEILRERNDAIAAALGACHLCFGEERSCAVCRGAGLPGWRPPEPAAFRRYVAPALHRARALAARAPSASTAAAARVREHPDSLGGEGPPPRYGAPPGVPRRS